MLAMNYLNGVYMDIEFPRGFLWGVSLSGFQFEMGDPKGEGLDPNSDWYVWVHDPLNISTGLVSGDLPENGCGYWVYFERDHDNARWLNLNAFRLGVEWSRVFPKPTFEVEVDVQTEEGHIVHVDISENALSRLDGLADKRALERYRAIIQDLKDKGFSVTVNLHHFTTPLWLHNPLEARATGLKCKRKGWVGKEAVVEFAKYAAYVSWKLGDLVDSWSTFNEPMVVSRQGYLSPISGFPPGVLDFEAFRSSSINLIEAHARGYDAIKRWDANGKADVGIIYAVIPVEPLNPEDEGCVKAASRLNYQMNLWFMNAVAEGLLDEKMVGEDKAVALESLKNRLDWVGVNYYSRLVAASDPHSPLGFKVVPGYGFIGGYGLCGRTPSGNPLSDFGWEIYPKGLREALNLMARYGRPLFVTENGVADRYDRFRSYYLLSHLYQLYRACRDDGLDVRGYYHWSLMDNYEWARGFSMRFGLFYVNFDSKLRAPRPSAYVFREIASENAIPEKLLEYAENPNAFMP